MCLNTEEVLRVGKTVVNGCNGETAVGPLGALCCPSSVAQKFVSVNYVLGPTVVFPSTRRTWLIT